MKCPVCVDLGLTSRLDPTSVPETTSMNVTVFYDEDGNYHIHDPNVLTTQWVCTNGHAFSYVKPNTCPSCDYNSRPGMDPVDDEGGFFDVTTA